MTMPISFLVNGLSVTVLADPAVSLLDVLRDELGLTGTKQGCDHEGECGACTILLDGVPVRSCLTSIGKVSGHSVLTVEGLDGLAERELGGLGFSRQWSVVHSPHKRNFTLFFGPDEYGN